MERKSNSKALMLITITLMISVVGFFLLKNEGDAKTEIEAVELALSLGELTKSIYREKGVYVEIFIEKGREKHVIDLTTRKHDIQENIFLKITPFFTQKKINELTTAAGGNLKASREISEIFKYSYQKVKAAYPEVPELYEGSIKIIPLGINMQDKIEDIDKQLLLLEQRLKELKY